MKLVEGKTYRTRGGHLAKGIYLFGGEWVSETTIEDYYPMWTLEGKCAFFPIDMCPDYPEYDLVEEVEEDA